MKTFVQATRYRNKKYPPTILIIAKRTVQILKLRQTLENNDCQVYWAETSAEALNQAKQNSFDLIIFDLEPSAENGLAIYRELRCYPELANLPAVILGLRELFSQGMNEFREAPVHFLAKDTTVEARLLQLIELIYYLRYRYLDLVP